VNAALREALSQGAARLQAAGIESARLDARILLSQALGVPSDAPLSAEASGGQLELFETLVSRRAAREPLAYITGRKEFWSLEFEVGPGVLVPRPESETLIEAALRYFPDAGAPLRALDIGVGSGCLLIAFLSERRHASGLGVDASEAALDFARRNAARHGLGERCRLELVDPRSALDTSPPSFDVILANPPYLTDEEFAASAPEIRVYEPREAFVAGSDGLQAFRDFASLAARLLSPDGMAFFEIGAGQTDKVTKILMDAGLDVRRVVHDLSGIPRCLTVGRAREGSHWRP
jgi:release factor glutamine methyltransferase